MLFCTYLVFLVFVDVCVVCCLLFGGGGGLNELLYVILVWVPVLPPHDFVLTPSNREKCVKRLGCCRLAVVGRRALLLSRVQPHNVGLEMGETRKT